MIMNLLSGTIAIKNEMFKKKKKKLLPIARHPDRVIDWCMSEDEKRRWKSGSSFKNYLTRKSPPYGVF